MAKKIDKPKTVKDLKDIPGGTKPDTKGKPQELPGVTGPGVSALKIPALDKLIAAYETQKEKRCQETPGEKAKKQELQFGLQQQGAILPRNKKGLKFYHSSDYERSYVLAEVLKIEKDGADDDGDDD